MSVLVVVLVQSFLGSCGEVDVFSARASFAGRKAVFVVGP